MTNSASGTASHKAISAQNLGKNKPLFEMEAMKPSDMSSAFIAIFIFVILWFIMQLNYTLILTNFEITDLATKLSNNTFKIFTGVAIILCAGLYGIIYKFVFNGNRDAAAVGVAAKFSAGAVGLAAIIANARITPFLDLVGMFENTMGIFYICRIYSTHLKSIITILPTDNKTITEDDYTELASIYLSRAKVETLANYNTDPFQLGVLSITYNVEELKEMVILKNAVAQFCWLFFAVVAATFASIPELISIA